jgi:hypothetical protein
MTSRRRFDTASTGRHLAAAMILRLSAVCESARERPDGRLDLVGVFDELSAPGFPAMQEHMTAVFLIEWDADETGQQPLRADLLDEAGAKVITIQGHAEVAARPDSRAPARSHLVMPLQHVGFRAAGRYRFELVAGGTVAEGCSFYVGLASSTQA